jgi:hypothetical protein
VLKHPIYAGAYAYGRRQVDPLLAATLDDDERQGFGNALC